MINKLLLFFSLIFMCHIVTAQELEFKVKVNGQKATSTDPKVFESLEKGITEMLNNQKWTDDVFEIEEKIKCNIQIIINSASGNNFQGQLVIQAARPVYGSNYETSLITHQDPDFNFSFEQFQPIQYTPNAFSDNLTSVLAFYAYIILGLDYDSFSPFGGEKYFQTAQDILSLVPADVQQNAKGWSSLSKGKGVNRTRYWMIENLLTPRVRPFRQAFYDYHRQGLDMMYKDTEAGKAAMMSALEAIDKVNKSYPNAMILQMFTNAKSSEIIEVFKLGSRQQKTKVFQIMAKLDAANASKYRAIGR